jgi:hypothetical protein
VRKAWIAGVLLCGGVVLWIAAGSEAGKPSPPPSSTVDSGIIYYAGGSGICSMKPDGTGKTVLFSWSDLEALGFDRLEEHQFEPSWGTHGGERWFLVTLPVPDGSGGSETWPDGSVREEVYALTADGESVRLTDGWLLDGDGVVTGWIAPHDMLHSWADDGSTTDGMVSFLGQEYGMVGDDWAVVERTEHLYVVTFDPEDLPGASALDLVPERIGLPLPLITTYPGNLGYSWSPGGQALIFRTYEDPSTPATEAGLWRGDFAGGEWTVGSTALHDSGKHPRWSRTGDGSKDRVIFFYSDILSMTPDGTDLRTVIVKPANTRKLTKRLSHPHWSPKATHIVYMLSALTTSATGDVDVYRAAADGSGQTNLTGDTSDNAWPLGWRAE